MPFAPLYPILYQILKPAFPSCLWCGENQEKAIALTFDDGPNPKYTPQLLQVLDRYNVPATFFWLGANIDRHRAVAKAVRDRGHGLGLHGYYHQSFPSLSESGLKQSLEKTQNAIARACGIELEYVQREIRDVRPPNGFFTPKTLKLLKRWNYRCVMWSVVPEDWVCPGVSIVISRIMRQVQNGSLIVLHDGDQGGADVVETTAQLIPKLIQQGYKFVKVEDLWINKARFAQKNYAKVRKK